MKTLLLIVLFSASGALAQAENPERLRGLYHQFHCMVCAGQSLAESDAKLAVNMRAQIKRMLAEGKSDAEIRDYFVARYGEGILMQPPVSGSTLPLWLAPGLVALLGLVLAGFYIRRHRG